MHAAVVFEHGGRSTRVSAGGIIGRLPDAGLRLTDPRISEAHALVSLRDHRLVLLALRGRLQVGRTAAEVVPLSVGQCVSLARGLVLRVTELFLPTSRLALTGLGATPVALQSEVATLHRDPWRLEPGFDPTGQAHIVSSGGHWVLHREGVEKVLELGDALGFGGHQITVVELPLGSTRQTHQSLGARAPLTLVAQYETVHIHRPGHETAVITGVSARILTELVRFAAPTPWDWVAREVFGTLARHILRQRWDRNLRTLRRKLREAAIRGDLVFSDGHGNVELVLGPDDTAHDES